MWPGRVADHSPHSSAAVTEEWSYYSTHPLGNTGPVTGSLCLLYLHIVPHTVNKFDNYCGNGRPLGRTRRRWVDNIRMDLREVGCGYMDWIGLAQDRDRWRTLVSAVMNIRVP